MGQHRVVEPLDRPIERRGFIKLLLAGSILSAVAMVVTPVIGFLIPSKRTTGVSDGRLLVGAVGDIAPGRSKVVALGSKPVIVLNNPQGLKAFSAVCTHLGCIVGYDASLGPDIVSPCHGGHFSAFNGSVLAGPPPTPLREYAVTVEKDQVFVQDA
jgi:cytochrome b6-f complex iron-sulfur subunit